jgi:hypothetical protein
MAAPPPLVERMFLEWSGMGTWPVNGPDDTSRADLCPG